MQVIAGLLNGVGQKHALLEKVGVNIAILHSHIRRLPVRKFNQLDIDALRLDIVRHAFQQFGIGRADADFQRIAVLGGIDPAVSGQPDDEYSRRGGNRPEFCIVLYALRHEAAPLFPAREPELGAEVCVQSLLDFRGILVDVDKFPQLAAFVLIAFFDRE